MGKTNAKMHSMHTLSLPNHRRFQQKEETAAAAVQQQLVIIIIFESLRAFFGN